MNSLSHPEPLLSSNQIRKVGSKDPHFNFEKLRTILVPELYPTLAEVSGGIYITV